MPATPTQRKRQQQLLYDPLKLSEALGYDFHKTAHGLELIRSIAPAVVPKEGELAFPDPAPFGTLSPIRNRLILWSRGHFKTSAVALNIVNLILAYPDIRILLMQSTAVNARGLLLEVKSHFNGRNDRSQLPDIFPDFCTEGRLGDSYRFTVPARKRVYKEHTVTVAGEKTSKAGQHYDYMFADDLVTEQNFVNQDLQEKLIVEFNHYSSLLAGTAGYKTVTGTRYSFGDLYGHIIRKDKDRHEWEISVKNCWKDTVGPAGGPLFPAVEVEPGRLVGFTTEQLLALQKDDPQTFSCQYLNQPLIASEQIFTEEALMRAVRPVNAEIQLGPAYQFIDLGGKNDGNDNSVVVTGRTDTASRMYVTSIRSGRFTPLQFAHVILQEALIYRPINVLIEGTAAGQYFIEYLRLIANEKGVALNINPIKVKTHKDAKRLRISAMDAPVKQGRLLFAAGLPNWIELVEQFVEFPRGRKDDEIDTISLMVQHFTSMNQGFRPSAANLPFFLRPGTDYGVEKKTFLSDDFPQRETCGDGFVGF